jgi:hypothetical protein
LKSVLRHKYFVLLEGLKLGVPLWILICHDWDKFLPDEFVPYARCFYKPDGTKQYVESPAFNEAWLLHQNRNKHHWQYWLLTLDSGETIALMMPKVYRLEMIADWHGAGRAYKKSEDGAWTPMDTVDWWEKTKATKQIHPITRILIEAELADYVFYIAGGKYHATTTDS